MNWKNMLTIFFMAVAILACSKDDGPAPQPDPIDQPDPTPEPENNAPVANAGDDQKVIIGSSVKINASSSSDPDGDDLDFDWTFISKPEGSDATIIGAGQSDAEFTMDKAGVYELELRVGDGELEAMDVLVVTNKTPFLNEVGISFYGIQNLFRGPDDFGILGDFFSPNIQENTVMVGDLVYEIDYVNVEADGTDYIEVLIPEEARSGELKLIVGEEEVIWEAPILKASLPVDDFVQANTHLERQRRSDGNNPDTYFEIGTRFRPQRNGKVMGFLLRMPKDGDYEVTLWDAATKDLMQSSIVRINSSSTRSTIIQNPIVLQMNREYIISVNANDWFLHIDEQDAKGNHFPKTYNNVELLGTAYHSGPTTAIPDEGFPVNYIVYGPDIIFAADPE